MDNNELDLHTELKKLIDKYKLLKNELANLIEVKQYAIINEIPRLKSEYKVKIGFIEYKCFALQTEINAMRHEIKIRQVAINRRQRISNKEVKSQIEEDLKKRSEQMEQLRQDIKLAKLYFSENRLSEAEEKEIKLIYRKLVRKLHPDLNPAASEEEKQLWIRANEAYKKADVEELAALLIMAKGAREDVELIGGNTIDNINEKINVMQTNISRVMEEINELQLQFPLNLEKEINDEAWVEAKIEEISKKIKALNKEKVYLMSMLSEFV